MALADIIELYSEYRVGALATDDITDAQLATLKTNTEARLDRIIGSRAFSTGEYEELTAFIVCDILENRHGKGTIISESVKDSSWKSQVKTSSSWLDRVYAVLAEYDSEHTEISDLSAVADIDGVRRTDSYVPEIMHGYSDEYEGV